MQRRLMAATFVVVTVAASAVSWWLWGALTSVIVTSLVFTGAVFGAIALTVAVSATSRRDDTFDLP